MKKIIVLFTILFVACHAFAQEKISGYVEDSLTHNRLTNVSVTLLRNGKPLKFTRTKEDGTFLIPIAQKETGDMLQASYMGYKKQKTAVSSGKETIIRMASTAFVLKEVQAKERCDFCNYRNGYDFIIYSKAEKKDEVADEWQ